MTTCRILLSVGLLAVALAACGEAQQPAGTAPAPGAAPGTSGYSGYTGVKLSENQVESLRQRASLLAY